VNKLAVICIVLAGCKREHAAPAKTAVVCNVELGSDVVKNHDALFKRGSDLIEPYIHIDGRTASTSPNKARDLREGIECFDQVVAIDANNWPALWLRGKAYQAAGSHIQARDSFAAAYHIDSTNPNVGRELGLELLDTGDFANAAKIDAEIADAHPEDPGLRANLALARLLAGDVTGAKEAADAAAAAAPSDEINARIKQLVDNVAAGKHRRPTSAAELGL
jgi:tetratricopeptide (TPR) repeat protein